ncbi:hypothetical protein F3K36_06585 [Delftia sp. BR1]|nr:hypothetical protein F3K36_06585 [Delftia sp. BR1]
MSATSPRSSSSGGWKNDRHPLSRCAASPSLASREGDDTLAAGRPLLGVPGFGLRRFLCPAQRAYLPGLPAPCCASIPPWPPQP